ncbi:glycoside hydrolase family 43 protein [Sphingomonas sp. 1P08PE]|uniref:glycoside hydrolase family 43 protein n=1 Tax=Sphingomonas sp. 1P08PE TaxID=554122 RepID=UPI0039A16BB5
MGLDLSKRELLAASGALLLAGPVVAGPAADDVLLLCYFQDKDEGREGLRLATSRDGYVFEPLRGGAPFLKPMIGDNRLMRDPSITRGPDGVYHMLWTTDWFGEVIGHASSRDLRNWSPQQAIPVMRSFSGVRNTWAPESFYDPVRRHFVIFWSSSVAGRFGATDEKEFAGMNHRPYCTTTRDFRTFTPTRLWFDPGYDSIDFTLLRLADGALRLVFKDERHGKVLQRNLRTAEARTPLGPFGPASPAFTPPMTEGPTATRLGNRYIVYYDIYEEHRFGAKMTTEFVVWEDVSSRVLFPVGARHGTVLRVPSKLVDALI